MSFANGRISGTPPANFNGSIGLRVIASDGLATSEDWFALIFDPAADAPVAVDDVGPQGTEDQARHPGFALSPRLDPDATGFRSFRRLRRRLKRLPRHGHHHLHAPPRPSWRASFSIASRRYGSLPAGDGGLNFASVNAYPGGRPLTTASRRRPAGRHTFPPPPCRHDGPVLTLTRRSPTQRPSGLAEPFERSSRRRRAAGQQPRSGRPDHRQRRSGERLERLHPLHSAHLERRQRDGRGRRPDRRRLQPGSVQRPRR